MKDLKFNFLNFYTMYESKGSVDKPLKREYCFSTIFYQGPNTQDNHYVLEILKNGAKDNYDNNCLLTTEQLVEHINEIKHFHNFEHELFEHEDKYVLKFHIKAPRMKHKIILSWLRYSYEFPFNVALYEAFKVKNITGFKRAGLFNLFNIIGASMHYSKHGTDIHAIGKFDVVKSYLNWTTFKSWVDKAIKRDPKGEINYVIPTKNIAIEYINIPNDMKITEMKYWINEDEFKNRIKVYKSNLKTIKNN